MVWYDGMVWVFFFLFGELFVCFLGCFECGGGTACVFFGCGWFLSVVCIHLFSAIT